MCYRPLGDSGLAVSVVGIGCYNFGKRINSAQTGEIVHTALDAGITFFDTSDTYGDPTGASEELLGVALRGRRHEAVIATKFGSDMAGANGPDWGQRGSRRYLRLAVEASLRRLGTDWIDLYQMHLPDKITPIEETLSTLNDLVKQGKVRYVGCSNFAAWQLADADWAARTVGYSRFISAQNRYNLLDRTAEVELIPACRRFGIGLLPYSPLADGLLTGKYRRGAEPPVGSRLADPAWRPRQRIYDAPWDKIETLEAFAKKCGHSLLELAIGGLASQPIVASVITGATSAEQVRTNAAAGDWKITAEDNAELNRMLAMRQQNTH
jgi:aryl-alcohol dehydrogenase-like predicted oxidoreductase